MSLINFENFKGPAGYAFLGAFSYRLSNQEFEDKLRGIKDEIRDYIYSKNELVMFFNVLNKDKLEISLNVLKDKLNLFINDFNDLNRILKFTSNPGFEKITVYKALEGHWNTIIENTDAPLKFIKALSREELKIIYENLDDQSTPKEIKNYGRFFGLGNKKISKIEVFFHVVSPTGISVLNPGPCLRVLV